jgi:hypothetical protein
MDIIPPIANRRAIEKQIVDLRELIRCTLDRSAHSHLREKLMLEIEKLKHVGAP